MRNESVGGYELAPYVRDVVSPRHWFGVSGLPTSVNTLLLILFLATKRQFVAHRFFAEPLPNSYCDHVSYRIITGILR